jgi:hypothetical protein
MRIIYNHIVFKVLLRLSIRGEMDFVMLSEAKDPFSALSISGSERNAGHWRLRIDI